MLTITMRWTFAGEIPPERRVDFNTLYRTTVIRYVPTLQWYSGCYANVGLNYPAPHLIAPTVLGTIQRLVGALDERFRRLALTIFGHTEEPISTCHCSVWRFD